MILELENVTKSYSLRETAIRGASFCIEKGEFSALSGPSGSGKSTLLNLSAGLDTATSGLVKLFEKNLNQLTNSQRVQLRRDRIGFVFQNYHLFPVLTAIENIEYPLALKGVSTKERRRKAETVLNELGCPGLGKRLPRELSGGQQQRVAIARAIAGDPEIVFADEPTANVDSVTAEKLVSLMKELNETKKITFLFSSHDDLVLRSARRIIRVSNGYVQENHPPHFGYLAA